MQSPIVHVDVATVEHIDHIDVGAEGVDAYLLFIGEAKIQSRIIGIAGGIFRTFENSAKIAR